MKDISLHILDIVQNSVSAGATLIDVEITEDTSSNSFKVLIRDNGRGMSKEVLEKVVDPYYTSRTTRRVGLGIPLFKQNAEQCGGRLKITSDEGMGTQLEASFVYDHIDRPSLGDIAGVMVLLFAGNPDIRFRYNHIKDKKQYNIDTCEIREALGGMPIEDQDIIRYIKEMIRENLEEIGAV